MPQAFVTLFCEAIKAVLRTLSGLRFCSPGKRSATGGDIPHTAKNPVPFGTGFFLNAKTKSPVFRPTFLLYLMPGSSLLSHGETP
ncbi:hypothetical protein, partial [Klebsiella pneumoniae]|uniref:hypothetical protein n=1 Tax=Klebsiella pneumoniae TaxID=573 RepID=UPI0022710CE4